MNTPRNNLLPIIYLNAHDIINSLACDFYVSNKLNSLCGCVCMAYLSSILTFVCVFLALFSVLMKRSNI